MSHREVMQQALEAWDDPAGMKDLCVAMDALRTKLEQQAEPVLQTCNCRWDGDVQVQQCTLHEAHVDAIHEWAERAKVAERKLEQQAEPVSELQKRYLESEKAFQQQAEPVSHAVIVGALFDFMGWLTTRKERLILSSTDNASPAADAIKVFAEMRGLSLDDALVQDWQNYTAPPQQQAEPSQWRDMVVVSLVREGVNKHKARELADHFAAPPQRQWVGLTDEDIQAIHDTYYRRMGRMEFAQKLEAKLKEKNT